MARAALLFVSCTKKAQAKDFWSRLNNLGIQDKIFLSVPRKICVQCVTHQPGHPDVSVIEYRLPKLELKSHSVGKKKTTNTTKKPWKSIEEVKCMATSVNFIWNVEQKKDKYFAKTQEAVLTQGEGWHLW